MAVLDQKAPAPGARIAVAMSGGVDSSVAAALLVEQGYEVVGLTMQLYDHGAATSKSKACCAGQDIYDARRVADRIGIPHYVLDYEKNFERDVIAPFADAYRRGETPVPCILCNQTVKFRDLIDAARDFGAESLATGHYIRRVNDGQSVKMYRAVDRQRDQSYFLFATTREQLDYLRFPLGDLPKTETRRLAVTHDLGVADKPDSQDICFVPDGRYTDVIDKIGASTKQAGRFIHIDGTEMGEHKGIEHYTVGQRRGLGLGGETEPLYVVAINPGSQAVVVGPRRALAKEEVIIRDLNWLGEGAGCPATGQQVHVRIRNTHEPVPGFVSWDSASGCMKVSFDEPLYGVSPGQACVLYDGDQVLGGGWIMADSTFEHLPHNKRAEVAQAPAA